MILDTYQLIKDEIDVRKNLIQLKSELKEGQNKSTLLYHMNVDYSLLEKLLIDSDPKIRKNVALIMGELGVPCFTELLFKAYEREEQLFIKSSYLVALNQMDYECFIPQLKERLNYLSSIIVEETNKKHIVDEIRTLSKLILDAEGNGKHEFIGYNQTSDLILLTNRNYRNITLEQIQQGKTKEFIAGVQVQTNNLSEIIEIRTYEELLFILKDLKTCTYDIDATATAIAESSLLTFLTSRHKGEVPFYFRIELKSKLPLDKKSAITKKLGAAIEVATGRQLINTTSKYEFELRLIENKEGNLNVLLKLYTMKDTRFDYRIHSIATSISPVNAALMAALTKEYMKEDAQVLDPFCGVGTMLMERNKVKSTKSMYGLDIYGDAIEKGKCNVESANSIVHFIHRDFFDFKHEYLFDEIFTNMPRALGHKLEDEIFTIYQKFFQKVSEHLKPEGIVVMYSHNKDYIMKLINKRIFRIEKEYEISKKEGAYLFVLRYL